jgi:hypothetical protein
MTADLTTLALETTLLSKPEVRQSPCLGACRPAGTKANHRVLACSCLDCGTRKLYVTLGLLTGRTSLIPR